MIALALAMLAPSASAQNRIVNGTPVTDFGLYPEVVAVQVAGPEGESICTGSLIHSEWVLTAAHCFDDINIAETPNGNSPIIVFGYDVNAQGTEETRVGNMVIVHENYLSIGPAENGTPNDAGGTLNDVALIHLSTPINRQPMALNPTPFTQDWIGLDMTFIGFGITEWQGSGSGTKRYVQSSILDYTPFIMQDLEPVTNGGTCQGDSGGPGVLEQGAGYIQISITAFGRECGTDAGSHMRVDAYVPWIEANLPPGTPLLKVAASPPTFECSHQLDPEAAESIALGVVPMDLRCEVVSAEPDTITEIEWQWGDGSDGQIVTDLRAVHTYTEMGVYNLSACIRGERDGGGGTTIPYENCITRPNHVNACGIPDVSFEVEQGDGLTLELYNTTPLRAYTCIANAQWEIYEGEAVTGEPLMKFSNWDPTVELEAPGTYTVVLNVGGLGGTGGAVSTIKVGGGTGCAVGGAAPGSMLLALLPLGLVGLRRRSSR